MSALRRDAVCAICGLAVCFHLVIVEVDESTHHTVVDRPAVVAAKPQYLDHGHEDNYVRFVSQESDRPGVDGGTAAEAPPPGTLLLDSARLAQRLARQRWHPAYYATSFSFVPPPEVLLKP